MECVYIVEFVGTKCHYWWHQSKWKGETRKKKKKETRRVRSFEPRISFVCVFETNFSWQAMRPRIAESRTSSRSVVNGVSRIPDSRLWADSENVQSAAFEINMWKTNRLVGCWMSSMWSGLVSRFATPFPQSICSCVNRFSDVRRPDKRIRLGSLTSRIVGNRVAVASNTIPVSAKIHAGNWALTENDMTSVQARTSPFVSIVFGGSFSAGEHY